MTTVPDLALNSEALASDARGVFPEDAVLNSALRSFVFGSFSLHPERQLVLKGETPLKVGGRAFDILTALVERAGEIVRKEELIARVWPGVFVEDSNLKVHMAILRRALGEDVANPRYIATVVGRGYRFVAPVTMFRRTPRRPETPSPWSHPAMAWPAAASDPFIGVL